MKKILSGLICLLISISIYANEYEAAKFLCVVTGDQSDLSNIELLGLPQANSFELEVISVKETNKVVKIKQSDDSMIKVKKVTRNNYLSDYYDIKFKKMSRKQTKKVLESLGALNVPKLPRGAKFSTLMIKDEVYTYLDNSKSVRAQVHFSPKKYDGLSYHINISCSAE